MLRQFCIALVVFAFAAPGWAGQGDVDKVNGSIRLEANETGGDLSTVNGSIHLGDSAHAGALETVNGAIELGDNASAASAETVNGHVELGSNARIDKGIDAVNGHITLGRGADVTGKVSNVNGALRLDGAHVGGGLETTSGDVDIGAGSHIEGGLLIEKPTGWASWVAWFERKPRIVIGPHAVVAGKLDIRREVDLYVSDSATIGPVHGATPVMFSGDNPPS